MVGPGGAGEQEEGEGGTGDRLEEDIEYAIGEGQYQAGIRREVLEDYIGRGGGDEGRGICELEEDLSGRTMLMFDFGRTRRMNVQRIKGTQDTCMAMLTGS